MQYLIAHKVRGERAFDIAEQMEVGTEQWWIIPTSGHRAYPYWVYPLSELFAYKHVGDPPADLRDHYSVLNEPPARAPRRHSNFDIPTAEDL